jgi:hypothetical protein
VTVRAVEQAKTTLRFFERHPTLLYAKDARVKRKAWRDVGIARSQVIRGRALLAQIRAKLNVPAHLAMWKCIHRKEALWTDNASNNPHYGGLQMGMWFMRTYAPALLRERGTANHWPALTQMWVAENAWKREGYALGWLRSQWQTSYGCA